MPLPKAAAGSAMQNLKANRERLLKDRTTTLRIPGWDSLYARYKRLPWEAVRPLSTLAEDDSDAGQQVGVAIDALIAACDGMFYCIDNDGVMQDLDLRYEQGLAAMIGDDDAAMPAEVVMSVFADDELTLMAHVGEYMAWATRQEESVAPALGKDFAKTGA